MSPNTPAATRTATRTSTPTRNDVRAPVPWTNGWRRGFAERLPPELWGSVLHHLRSPSDALRAGLVCRAWAGELFSSSAEPMWRAVWEARSIVPGESLTARVVGGWRAQVAASARLAGTTPPATLFVPPRERDGAPVPDDVVETRPRAIDVEDLLGRARCAIALPEHVLIAMERGIALLCLCGDRGKKPFLFYDASPRLACISRLFRIPGGSASGPVALAATGAHELTLLSVLPVRSHARARIALRSRPLHCFSTESAALVSLASSACGKLALLGFANGRIHVVCASGGGLKHVLSMREPADLVAAAGRWVVSASALQPVGAAVWHASDGRAQHRFDRTAVGWEEVVALSGLAPAAGDGRFALWNGKDCVRILCARTGRFVAVVNVDARFGRVPARAPADEAERGAASAHVGPDKMVVGHGAGRALVATSNRVFAVSLPSGKRAGVPGRGGEPVPGGGQVVQLDGALRSLVALSTDERSVVTADGDAFGGLRAWVLGRESLTKPACLRVWDAATGAMRSATELPCAAGGLSVSGDVAVVFAERVGQVVVHRFRR